MVARAELFAALWARSHFGDAKVVTDCLYVRHGCTALRTGKGAKSFLQGPDGDLWKRMAALGPPDVPHPGGGLPARFAHQWEGNHQADLVAKQAAQDRAPSPELVGRQQGRMALYTAVMGVVVHGCAGGSGHSARGGPAT